MHQQLTKIGPSHGVPRRKVWIEGKRLTEQGFTVGTRYRRTEDGNTLTLTKDPDGPLKVSGKGDKPIIDISGSIIPRVFPEPATHVTVTFQDGGITLSANL